MSSSEQGVFISLDRLRALETVEAKRIESLKKLRERDIQNPEQHSKRVLKHYYKNKEAINEKRRAAYKAKKEAEAAAKANAGSSQDSPASV